LHFSQNGFIIFTVTGKTHLSSMIYIPVVLVAVVLVTALVLLMRRAAFDGSSLPLSAEWIDELSLERYRPMIRLLDGKDIDFLRSQPGFTPKMARKLRQQRCQIFRGYLRSLSADFRRVCAAIKILMMQSRQDRPDLAGILFHQQMMFALGMISVQSRLVLYRLGICGVEVSSLVRIFDSMRIELRSLVPAATVVGA
jgi:hypothetical protein